jgi:hypothetical protein
MERKSCFRVTRSHPSDEDLSPGTPASRQEADDEAKVETVALQDGDVMKYSGDGEEAVSPGEKKPNLSRYACL